MRIAAAMRRLGLAALAGMVALALAPSALAGPPIWVVKSPTATIYLFGTIHAMAPDARWRTPRLDAAYAASTTLWFEVDVTGPAMAQEAQSLVAQYGIDAEHPLSGKLDAAHMAALKAALAPLGLPDAGLERLQPWTATLVLLALPMAKAGLDTSAGADELLEKEAAADHKTVRDFETAENQVRIFAGLPEAAQAQMLDESIDDAGKSAAEIKAMERAWLSGDLDRLGPLLVGQLESRYPAFYEALVRRRNQAWAETLSGELAGPNVELVSVGALHMVGPDGLPALLKAKGFKVSRLQ